MFQDFQVLVVQESLIAPLSAGMAAQIAKIGDAETELPDLVGQAAAALGIEHIKKTLFRFQ